MIKRDAIKKLNDMLVDSQAAQHLGIKVFNGQCTADECQELIKIADDLISAIQTWKAEIPNPDNIPTPD